MYNSPANFSGDDVREPSPVSRLSVLCLPFQVSFPLSHVSSLRSPVSVSCLRFMSHIFCLLPHICSLLSYISCLSVFCLLSHVSWPYLMSRVSQLLSPVSCLLSTASWFLSVSRLLSQVYCLSHFLCQSHVSCLSHVFYLSHVSYCISLYLFHVSFLSHIYCLSLVSYMYHVFCMSHVSCLSHVDCLHHKSFPEGVRLACGCVSVRCKIILQI